LKSKILCKFCANIAFADLTGGSMGVLMDRTMLIKTHS